MQKRITKILRNLLGAGIFVNLIISGFMAHAAQPITGTAGNAITPQIIAQFQNPWALRFIQDDLLIVTTKSGDVWQVNPISGSKTLIDGLPDSFEGGQGGFGDIIPHPAFNDNKWIYFSFVHSDDGGQTRYSRVMRGQFHQGENPYVDQLEVIWDQFPPRPGYGHFSHRLAFAPPQSSFVGDLFITSGDRQEQTPAQDWDSALGKIIRLHDDGRIPLDNPFQDKGDLAKSFWSIGHRNALGLAFDSTGQIWAHEMGPRHGDELNLIHKGHNYGWPLVSEGDHYSGASIPSHDTRPDITAPKAFWVPTIAPSGLAFYNGNLFPQFRNNAFIGGLRSRALIRLSMMDNKAVEQERFQWNKRVRDVTIAADGSIWVIEDGKGGRLIRFTQP